MRSLVTRLLTGTLLALVAWLVLAGAGSVRKEPIKEPDKLVILSTVDVKGKTSPCG